MIVFLDFEASSLSERSYPIEAGWVFEDGRGESRLIRPAPRWTDWDAQAEAIHGIPRAMLLSDGLPHEEVAREMVAVLAGHDLCASAPSWDGKWLGALLRAADLPRHSLRLRGTDAVVMESAMAILAEVVDDAALADTAESLMTIADLREQAPAHRALADAEAERQRWLAVCDAARAHVAAVVHGEG